MTPIQHKQPSIIAICSIVWQARSARLTQLMSYTYLLHQALAHSSLLLHLPPQTAQPLTTAPRSTALHLLTALYSRSRDSLPRNQQCEIDVELGITVEQIIVNVTRSYQPEKVLQIYGIPDGDHGCHIFFSLHLHLRFWVMF